MDGDAYRQLRVRFPYEPLRKSKGSEQWSDQKAFVESRARYPALKGGRGSGKSLTGARKFAELVLAQPMDSLVMLPYEKQFQQGTLEVLELMLPKFCVLPGPKSDFVQVEKGQIDLFFGDEEKRGRIFLRTAENPGAVRSMNLGAIWMDEVQDISREARNAAWYACRVPGTPQVVMSTFTMPEDEGHWAYETWVNPDRPHPEIYPCWSIATKDNYELDELTRQLWYEQETDPETGGMTSTGLRELEAVFAGSARAVFRLKEGVQIRPLPVGGGQWEKVTAGIDLGGGDAADAVVVVGENTQGRVVAFHEYVQKGGSPSALIHECIRILDQWPQTTFWIDWTYPRTLELLQESGIDVQLADKDIGSGYRELWGLLEPDASGSPRMYLAPHLHTTIKQMKAHRFREGRRRDNIDYTAFERPKAGDDCVAALRYACMGLRAIAGRFLIPVEWGASKKAGVRVLSR